jgi:hypothetical protein
MNIISDITGIGVDELLDFKPGMHDLRPRLRWASKRHTTRVEDRAYSLLGIFDVSLGIAYGEGEIAFVRLQVEIMQRCHDKGLFMWNGKPSPYNSMLALGPECFASNVMRHEDEDSLWSDRDQFAEDEVMSDESYEDDSIYEEFAEGLQISSHSTSPGAAAAVSTPPDPTFTMTNHGLRISTFLYDAGVEHDDGYPQQLSGPKWEYRVSVAGQKVTIVSPEKILGFKLAVLGWHANLSPLFILLSAHFSPLHTVYRRVTQFHLDELNVSGARPTTKRIFIL